MKLLLIVLVLAGLHSPAFGRTNFVFVSASSEDAHAMDESLEACIKKELKARPDIQIIERPQHARRDDFVFGAEVYSTSITSGGQIVAYAVSYMVFKFYGHTLASLAAKFKVPKSYTLPLEHLSKPLQRGILVAESNHLDEGCKSIAAAMYADSFAAGKGTD